MLFRMSNMTVRAGAQISAYGRGFRGSLGSPDKIGLGPGGGDGYGGGGYGGIGGYVGKGGVEYGSAAAPRLPGSGSGNQSTAPGVAGGGLIRVQAAEKVTIDGTINANGGNGYGYVAGGSGGGIYITCNTIEGSGGSATANGGTVSDNRYGRGGGGRIAVVYNTAAQAALSVPDIVFSAIGYAKSTSHLYGELGSLYFPDAHFLTETMLHSGYWVIPGLTNWGTDSLTVSNAWIRFEQPGFVLTVTNNLLVTGSSSSLDLVPGHTNRTSADCFSSTSSGSTLRVMGDLTMTNGAWMYIGCAVTNSATPTYGALIDVDGTLAIADTCKLYLRSNPTNGGSAYLNLGALNVSSGATVSAGSRGYGVLKNGANTPHGPGVGDFKGGAGHGGVGGTYSSYDGGPAYGSSNTPVKPGSCADNSYARSGDGGGVVHIDVEGAATVDGTVSVSGGSSTYRFDAGGSAGSIWLWCRSLQGEGAFNAVGGRGGSDYKRRNNGAGGRIALWRAYDSFTGSANADPGAPDAGYTANAGTGSVVYVDTGPSVTNLPATNVGTTVATMVGELIATGQAPSEVYCFWGPTDQLAVKDNWKTNVYLGWSLPAVITNYVTGLPEGSNTYYRFYATNMYGDNWSEPSAVFSTIGIGAVNNAAGPTNLSETGVTLRGDVTAGNPTPDAYFCWGDADGGADTSTWQNVIYMGEVLGAMSTGLTNLLANKTYYYRCYVTNSEGPAWAPAKTNFTTKSPTMWIDNAGAVVEGNVGSQHLYFLVTISSTSAVDVTVVYATTNGWADAGDDYVATSGVLTIPAGSVTGVIDVAVKGDFIDEFPFQDFFVNLSAPTGAVLIDSNAKGVITDDDDQADTKTWTGTGDWAGFTNWSPVGTPGPLDAAIIVSGTAAITNSAGVVSLVVSNGAKIVFTNWMTKLSVTNTCTINGTVTIRPAFGNDDMSNRVWIACSDLLVSDSGIIYTDGKGYAGLTFAGGASTGNGPGGGYAYGSGGHGGKGGYIDDGGQPYGSLQAPEAPGSAGGAGNGGAIGANGGGAVRIDVSNTATVDGTITANTANNLS